MMSSPDPDRLAITYRVPYADTDQMGVVYYANYLVYFERFRNHLLRQSGTSYRQWEEEGVRLPVVEALCRYRSPAHYDDLIQVTGRAERVSPTRIRIEYQVWREETLLAEGYTVHASLRADGRPIRVPEGLLLFSGEPGGGGLEGGGG